jgi:PIN domain nuclease of toxin-antitoxin system
VAYYEIGRLVQRGRVSPVSSVRDWRARILSLGVREVELTAEIAVRASNLENLPRDPVDRFVVATALVEQALLLTADDAILSWSGPLKRQDAQL